MRKNKKSKTSLQATSELNIIPTPPPAVTPAPVAEGISGEVVAAISAAVYMMEGEGTVVTSIAPAAVRTQTPNPITRRNPWAFAAITENTRPF